MKRRYICGIVVILGLAVGCARWNAGMNDPAVRDYAKEQSQIYRDFVWATTGNQWAGMGAGVVVGSLFIFLNKKKPEPPK